MAKKSGAKAKASAKTKSKKAAPKAKTAKKAAPKKAKAKAKVVAKKAAKVVSKKVATKVAKKAVKKTASKAPLKVATQKAPSAPQTAVKVSAPLIQAGAPAPSFTLVNQDGKEVRLEDFRGQKKVILYFYPKAMTPGCTVQACGIRDNKEKFNEKDVVVLAVSPDAPESLKKFEEKEQLNFDLLSDVDHKVAESYGVWGLKKFMGREYMGVMRTTFVIGKDGEVKSIIEDVDTKTHHEDALNLADKA